MWSYARDIERVIQLSILQGDNLEFSCITARGDNLTCWIHPEVRDKLCRPSCPICESGMAYRREGPNSVYNIVGKENELRIRMVGHDQEMRPPILLHTPTYLRRMRARS